MAHNHRVRHRWLVNVIRGGFITCLMLTIECQATSGATPDQIDLTVIQERGAPFDSVSRWLEFLRPTQFGSLQLSAARSSSKPGLTTKPGDPPRYHVTATITRGNDLQLPGARIGLGDKASLTRWISRLGANRDEAQGRAAFGLTDRELIILRAKVNARWESSTQGSSLDDALRSLQQSAPLDVSYTAAARDMLQSATPCPDEVQGVSLGSALAALLRPQGLVWAPRKQSNGRIVMQIATAREVQQAWPIGWPLKQPLPRVMPKLMEKIEVEITATPLDQALAAIQSRLDLPFLVDRNGLAAQDIETATKEVKLNAEKVSYKRILDRLLFQALLEFELRQDEADRPLIWIQPIRR